jgi:hypothetical protein
MQCKVCIGWGACRQDNISFLAKISGDVPAISDSMDSQNYSTHFHMGSPHIETGMQIEKLPFGDSLFPNTICAHSADVAEW